MAEQYTQSTPASTTAARASYHVISTYTKGNDDHFSLISPVESSCVPEEVKTALSRGERGSEVSHTDVDDDGEFKMVNYLIDSSSGDKSPYSYLTRTAVAASSVPEEVAKVLRQKRDLMIMK